VAAEESWQEHEEIIAGLLKQDVEAAEAAMRRDIDNAQHKTIGMLLRK